jgi:hypothetical protein
LPDGRSRASASNGGVNPQGSSCLSDTCLSGLSSFRLAHRLGLTRSDRWHGAIGNPFPSTVDTASMVRHSSYGRESTRNYLCANSLGDARSARRRVVHTTQQSVRGAGRRALCGGWLLHLPSGRRTNRATCKSALRTLDFLELRTGELTRIYLPRTPMNRAHGRGAHETYLGGIMLL